MPDDEKQLIMPTVFHITHYKAGSQWVYAVLKDIVPQRMVTPEDEARHVTHQQIAKGMIYPCVYLPYHMFVESIPPWDHRVFIVIRDLRDTLVSLYFSVKYSHQMMNPQQQKLREILQTIDMSDGLIYLMEQGFYISVEIQRSWLGLVSTSYHSGQPGQNTNILRIRYEDLAENELAGFQKIISYCGIDVSEDNLKSVVEKNSFEKLTGRKLGAEDIHSHQRKGVVGDWRNYFDERVTEAFKRKFSYILIETGYEKDLNW